MSVVKILKIIVLQERELDVHVYVLSVYSSVVPGLKHTGKSVPHLLRESSMTFVYSYTQQ